jgi:glycosyltransferase involved in cell wall biosynthesis
VTQVATAGGPLSLLYYVEDLGVGGSVQTTVTVAREMKRRGHAVVFVSEDGPLRERLEEVGIEHRRVDTAVRHPYWPTTRLLARLVRRHRVDLLCPNGFDCTLDTVPAGLWTGTPVVPTYGGMYNLPYPHPRLPVVNLFSHEQIADLVESYGWPREICRNVIARIDAERFSEQVDGGALRAELGLSDEHRVLVTICRHDRLKLDGVLSLLGAAARIRRRVPAARLVLFGDGNAHDQVLARIEEVHREVGEPFVIAPGNTHRTPEAFAMADVVIANGARSALEGMACGRAVVSVGPNGFCGALTARSIAGFRRFNFDKGRLAGNPIAGADDLVACLARLVEDDALRAELERFSAAYARENLLIQSAAPEYERLYDEGLSLGWGGSAGRLRHAANWALVTARYLAYLARRRFGPDSPNRRLPSDLAPPPASVDPDWRVGLDDTEDAAG